MNAVVMAIAGLAVAVSVAIAQEAASDPVVPKDLRPLLAPRQSEMRLIVNRYTADRTLLATNYAGRTGGGRGGRGAAAPAPVISVNRIARLKRFDMSWQTAVDGIEALRLSPQAQMDLAALKSSIQENLRQLDVQASALAVILPLLPFTQDLVDLIEARIAVKDMDAENAARVLTKVTQQVKDIQKNLTDGLLRASQSEASAAAAAVELIRAELTEWNTFYNGYDPLYTWWAGLPYRNINEALQSYATLLRDTVAVANLTSNLQPASPLIIAPAPAARFSDIPDLSEILALPHDEMSDIVQLYRGRGARGGAPAPAPATAPAANPTPAVAPATAPRTAQYYNDWLAALKTLDFDQLSRNAQVDYLFLKGRAELALERMGRPLPATNPRKTDNSGIRGNARGREGLIRDLQDEFIPYTPEQLIVLAEREFAWCENEMRKAAREMGFGDDWKKALEKTKTMHPPPGGQPAMIRDLLTEAVDYVRDRDLVTVPQVEAESQHMVMMTPERQLVNPFFTGGGQIAVSFPTNTMEFEARLQSMRGNNRPWSHATAFHEMIPGHNLTGYMSQRYNGYRANLGGTPFFTEGWAVYWEVILYDMGFHDTPEERVGALFWRMFRCARIIFSLRFHMGQWSPQESIDFLVDRVGHERDNATAEVRRSFQGNDGPLYQAAYLLGALQMRGLRRELVDTNLMSNKEFHDEILRGGSMPIALIRLALSRQQLTRDMRVAWEFYGDLPDR